MAPLNKSQSRDDLSCCTKTRPVLKLNRKNSCKPKSAIKRNSSNKCMSKRRVISNKSKNRTQSKCRKPKHRKSCGSESKKRSRKQERCSTSPSKLRSKSKVCEEKPEEVKPPSKTIFLSSCSTTVVSDTPSDTKTCGDDDPEKTPVEKASEGCFKLPKSKQNKKRKRKSASRSCSSKRHKSRKRKRSSSRNSARGSYGSNSRPCRSKRVGPPTKPPTAFLLFFQDYLKEKRKEKPCLRSTDVAKEAAEAWCKLPRKTKDCYRARYCAQLKKMEEDSKKG